MHSVNDRESERTKISLRGDISLQVRYIPLPHFNDSRDYEGKRSNPSYWPYSHRNPS